MSIPGRGVIAIALVAILALALAAAKVSGPVRWGDPDALFYQAQSLEVRGDSAVQARRAVMLGHPGQSAIANDRVSQPGSAQRLESARWRRYSAPFYRRRWTVPVLTALLAPIFGERSLLIVSAVGYVLSGLLLFILLARRFPEAISAALTAVYLLAPPVRDGLLTAGTDSWGFALLLLALLCGVAALERGGWVFGAWFLVLVVLALTREDGVVALVAALWVALARRDRRSGLLAASATVAVLPAGLLLGAPLTRALAYAENGFNIPPSSSLSYALSHYLPALKSTLLSDLAYAGHPVWTSPRTLLWLCVLAVLAAGLVALAREPRPDPYFELIRGTVLGAALYILISINYTGLRLEVVFVPAVTVGLALLIRRLAQVPRLVELTGRRPRRLSPSRP